MNYSIERSMPLQEFEYSLEKQLLQGFKGFVKALLGHKTINKSTGIPAPVEKRNYFLQKYQQILNNGKSGNVQVIKVRKKHAEEMDKNSVVYLTFRLISEKGVRLFNAVAMATKENIPVVDSVIPIYFNPDDLSLVVLL